MSLMGPLDGYHTGPREGRGEIIAAQHAVPEGLLAEDALLHDAGADPGTGVPRWVWYAVAALAVAIAVGVVAAVLR